MSTSFAGLFRILVVSLLFISCTRNLEDTDDPVDPDDPSISLQLDSVIYHSFYGKDRPVQGDLSSSYKIWTFPEGSGFGLLLVDAFDSTSLYNGYAPVYRQRIEYRVENNNEARRVINVKSRKLNPSPYFNDWYDPNNVELAYKLLSNQVTPYQLSSLSWYDSLHTLPRFDPVIWNRISKYPGELDAYVEFANNFQDSFHVFEGGIHGTSRFFRMTPTERDSVVIESSSARDLFYEWSPPGSLVSPEPEQARLKFLFRDKTRSQLLDFNATVYKVVWQGNVGEPRPVYERHIRYTWDPALEKLLEAFGGEGYIRSIPVLQLFGSNYLSKLNRTDDVSVNGADWITRLRWASLTSRDTIFDVWNNRRVPIRIVNNTSEISKDSKGRIVKIVKRSSEIYYDRETIEFRYKN